MTMTNPATAEQLNGLLGEVDALVVERILQTGASYDEVAEALDALEDEAADGELAHTPSSAKVAEVREILAELVLDDRHDAEEEYGSSGAIQ
jgi:hypothetical protein